MRNLSGDSCQVQWDNPSEKLWACSGDRRLPLSRFRPRVSSHHSSAQCYEPGWISNPQQVQSGPRKSTNLSLFHSGESQTVSCDQNHRLFKNDFMRRANVTLLATGQSKPQTIGPQTAHSPFTNRLMHFALKNSKRRPKSTFPTFYEIGSKGTQILIYVMMISYVYKGWYNNSFEDNIRWNKSLDLSIFQISDWRNLPYCSKVWGWFDFFPKYIF